MNRKSWAGHDKGRVGKRIGAGVISSSNNIHTINMHMSKLSV
jgi:hypothetical protein